MRVTCLVRSNLLYLIIVMTFDVRGVPPSSNTRNVGSKSIPGMDVYPSLCFFFMLCFFLFCVGLGVIKSLSKESVNDLPDS